MERPRLRVGTTDDLPPELLAQVRVLLDEAFEGEFSAADWDNALGGWHVVALDGTPIAHASVVGRPIEVDGLPLRAGYVEGVATAPSSQGRGIGSIVMRRIGDIVRERFELGVLSTDAYDFYGRLGWERWAGPSFVRRAGELVRTPEDDDGIMVLRFGSSSELDLAAPISCDERDGDDW